jgi:hypothetical protein
MTAPLRCHRCGSAELVLQETRHDHAEWDGGLFVNEEGNIEAHGEGWFTQGDIQRAMARIRCESCGHEWRPRRRFIGSRF